MFKKEEGPSKKASKKGPPPAKAQAKTMPAGSIQQLLKNDDEIDPQLFGEEPKNVPQIPQQQQLVSPDPSFFQSNIGFDTVEEDDEVGDVQELKAKLEKIPSWAKQKIEEQTQQKIVPLKKKASIPQQQLLANNPPQIFRQKAGPPPPTEVRVNLAERIANQPGGLDSPAKYMSLLTTDPKEILAGISMKELRQVADILFYWPRFAKKTFRNVTTLDISFCTNVTDLGIRWISFYMQELKELNASGCRLLTEASLRYLVTSKGNPFDDITLTTIKLDMTSVRYIPLHPSSVTLSTKGCPILADETAVSKAKATIPNEIPTKFSASKIVVLKSVSMREKFMGPEFAKPDGDGGIGAATFICCYRSGPHTIVECCEDMPVQFILTDNCFVVLPYPGDNEEKADAVRKAVQSIEARFNLVASLVKNVTVVAYPYFSSASQPAQNAAGEPKFVDVVKNELNTMVKKSEGGDEKGENKDKDQSKDQKGENKDKDQSNFPPDKQVATLRYLMDHDLHLAPSVNGVMPWINKRLPHSDMPKTFNFLLQALEKSNMLSQKNVPFFTVEYLAQALQKVVPADFQTCWPSFISLLAETGNCWVEMGTSANWNDSSTFIGPRHGMASLRELIKLLTLLNTSSDSTAVAEDIQCLAMDTPLCTVDHVRQWICPNPGNHFSDDDVSRVMNSLEINGIALFRRRSALAMSVLRHDPPISVDHFLQPDVPSHPPDQSYVFKSKTSKITKSSVLSSSEPVAAKSPSQSTTTTVVKIDYPLICRPRSIFPSITAMAAKILPPTLLWRTGAFFYEASFLDVLITFDDIARTVSVRFSAESFVFDSLKGTFDPETTRGVEKLISALRHSCSIVHTICCIILSPFSNVNLTSLGTSHGFVNLPLSMIVHNIKLLPTRSVETFSRQFDSSVARCSACLFDVKTIAALRQLYLKNRAEIAGVQILRRASNENEHAKLKVDLSISDWLPVNDIGGSVGGFQPSFIDIMSVDDIQTIEIFPGDGTVKNEEHIIKLTFSETGNKLVSYSDVDAAIILHQKPDSGSSNSKAAGTINSKATTTGSSNKKTTAASPHPAKTTSEATKAKQPQQSHVILKGLRIEARHISKGNSVVTISTNGESILSTIFTVPASKFTVFIEAKAKAAKSVELPLYCHTPSILPLGPLALPGMRLEAVDRKNLQLVCAAHIKEINTDGQWLIGFDGWGANFDYWTSPTSPDLFPCGFMEYVAKNNLMEKFAAQRDEENMNSELQKPRNTTYPSDPFPWEIYIQNLQMQDLTTAVRPVSFTLFEKSHLLGYDSFLTQHGQVGANTYPDIKTLTHYCVRGRPSLLLNNTSNYASDADTAIFRTPRFIPLPLMTWSLCCWPSREKLTGALATHPHFLCCWPDFIHFVNETSTNTPNVSISAVPPLALAILLMKLNNQPRFIPDEFDQLFTPEFGTVDCCPHAYPSLSMKASGTSNKAAYLEHCIRQFLIPFLLDYLTIHSCYAEQSPNGRDLAPGNLPLAINDPALSESANYAVDVYLKKLHADGSSVSRWSAVTVTPEKPKPKCRLLNMNEAESETYNRDGFCPKLMCGQHAYHFTTYTKATEVDAKLDWTSSLHSFGHFHDNFLTMCAYNGDDIREMKQPLNETHPYMSEFVGLLSLNGAFTKSGIFSAKYLSELVLFRNNLTDLPAELSQLAPTLEELVLSYNLLEVVPKVVYELKNLITLQIDYSTLKFLDEKISQLSKLKNLSLRYNCLKSLPSGFKKLVNLETLDLSGLPSLATKSTMYLEEVASFFDKNYFPKEAVDVLAEWASSEEVESIISRPGIEQLNLYLFSKLPRLTVVGEAFPLDLSSFTYLRDLRFANQSITAVPDSIEKLTSLIKLDLSGCLLLESISAKVTTCPLEMLTLNNCPVLKTPPAEIRKRGFVATLAYFKRLAQGSLTCKRTKLMFVGLGGAGKTSLVHSLLADAEPATEKFEVTDGIDIKKWIVDCKDGSTIDFRMWDFAGQVVYYNTHQFFISSRAVYLLLWNIRLGHEHAGLEFWLSSIACHAPNAPILIVGTHADEVSQERSFLPEGSYRERFSSICGFHYVSTWTKQGIDALRENIIQVALAQKHMGEAIPAAWLTFEEKLLNRELHQQQAALAGVSDSVLMFDQVEKLGDSSGIYDPDEIDQALQFLSDLGTIQYFRTDFLRDRVIINPQWIVDVMSNVVSVKKVTIINGRLKHDEIGHIWESYPSELHQWLLKLTEAFDLTFPLKKEPVSIVPCLLSESPPDLNWPNLEDNPGFRQTKLIFSFKYLPTGLFNRVQVRLCQFSDGATIWRRGSLLRKNQHHALLTQPDSTTIQVKVQGPCPDNITFLILEVVDTLIVEAFQGVQPDYLFSCPACVNARASDPSMFERSRIRRAFELRIPFLQCWNYFHSVSTQELRQLFPAESSTEFDSQFSRTVQEISNIRQTLQIEVLVIGCLADADPAELKNAVSTPEVGKDIEKAYPNLNVVVVGNPDASTDAVSFDHLSVMMRQARLIVYCLSDKFMQSDRCQAAFFTGRETLKKQVLMILIRDFDWNEFPALAFQMNDDVFVKAVNRSRYKPADVAAKITQRLSQIASGTQVDKNAAKKRPDVFISYCWQNSKDAVSRGTKTTPKGIGVTDPRGMKKFLADSDIDCWIDVEKVGLGGLFRDIADGIRYAKCMVVCVSDEYTRSENCLREFHFATTSCKIPIILCPVGTGGEWQTSEVNLIVCQKSAFINFQVDLKDNYDALLNAVRMYVKPKEPTRSSDKTNIAAVVTDVSKTQPANKKSLGKIGRLQTMSNIQNEPASLNDVQPTTDAMQSSLVLHEMVELGQRKFLRQLISFTEASGSRPYPRLLIIDVSPVTVPTIVEPSETEVSDEKTEENNIDSGGDVLSNLQWNVRYLCEHEAGWHPSDVTLSLPVDKASQIIRQSADYFGQIFSFIRHLATASMTLELFSPKNEQLSTFCHDALVQIEKMANPDQNFDDDYYRFREVVMDLDQYAANGGLKKCQLALGRELWLCPIHQGSAHYKGGTDANTTVATDGTTQKQDNQTADDAGGEGDNNNPTAVRLRAHRAAARNQSDAGVAAAGNCDDQQHKLGVLRESSAISRQSSTVNAMFNNNNNNIQPTYNSATSRACSIQ